MTTVFVAACRDGNSKRYHTDADCRQLNKEPFEREKDTLDGWGWELCAICDRGTDAYKSDGENRRSLRRKLKVQGEFDE
jgi:hypothetical protein